MNNDSIDKKRILMCNYNCMCDSQKNVVGHTLKVTREYAKMLSSDFDIELLGAETLIDAISLKDSIPIENLFERRTSLPYQIYVDKPFTLKRRLEDKLGMFKNIKKCLSEGTTNSDSNILFFYQVDFFFFLYLFTHHIKKRNCKLCCLIYHQDFTGGMLAPVLQFVYRKALRKVDGVIYTQKGHPVDHSNVCWMPDYLYDKEKYDLYKSYGKSVQIDRTVDKPMAVALGTMNRYKQLEELIECFPTENISLRIIGRFDDEERFERLRDSVANDLNDKGLKDIVIENRVLVDEKYYGLLAKATYSIMPYDMNQYVNRTSGVLQESIFMDCIPIAPSLLLEQNELPGVGYTDICDIAQILNDKENILKTEKLLSVVREEYDIHNVQSITCRFISNL